MSVTGIFPSDRSPGLIRVLLSGVGPALIGSNITISNNEIYGEGHEVGLPALETEGSMKVVRYLRVLPKPIVRRCGCIPYWILHTHGLGR